MHPTKLAPRTPPSTRAGGPAFSIAVALAAVVSLSGSVAAAPAGGISIERPWMRFIIKARPAGGFFTVKNDTDKAVELTGASSTGCGSMMLHQTKEENGVEKMLPIKSVTVPPHGTLSFHPGGYHIMCMKPQANMAVGASVPVTLKFADGQTVTAQFRVTGPGDNK